MDGPAGPVGESVRRAALSRRCSASRRRTEIGSACEQRWPSCSPWPERAGTGGRAVPAASARWRDSIPRRRPSTVTCWLGPLPPEGSPPGCRVATRHGEKLLWKIGRTRRRNGWRRHLPRADAGELVRRTGGHRPGRARIDRPRQVSLRLEPARRGAGGGDDVARRAGLRRLRDDGAGAAGLSQHRQDRSHDDGERSLKIAPNSASEAGNNATLGKFAQGYEGSR